MEEITVWKWLIAIIIILTVFLYVPTFIAGPDGLEAVFETYGFTPPDAIWNGLLPDYTVPGIMNEWLTALLAGILGTFIVFGVMLGIGKTMVALKHK
ncbi:MAG: PDGLE domain-containing protein [Candidatus Helarchaeota archaeon]